LHFNLIIALVIIALLVVPAMGGDEVRSRKLFYEDTIDDEIAHCLQKVSLLSSRSTHLRMKGHREVSMALFLETHRNQLVDNMIELKLEPKTYKVERFLNDRFSCTCYSTWTAKGR
jgi:hypothetical protein